MVAIPSLTTLAASLALLSVGIVALGAKPAQRFPVGDNGTLRCRLPDYQAEPLLQWLVARYQEPSFLDTDGHDFRGAVLGDRVEEAWFDDQSLSLLQAKHEVHHVRRVGQGATAGVSDILYLTTGQQTLALHHAVDPTAPTRFQDALALHDLVTADQRPAVELTLRDSGIRPASLERTLRLDRKRHGILLSDQTGPCLEIAVDQCTSLQQDLALRWVEFEVSIPPARNGDAVVGETMQRVRTQVLEEVRAQFPQVKPESEGPYATVFLRLQSGTWLPLRTLHELKLSDQQAKIALLMLTALTLSAPALIFALRRVRGQRHQRNAQLV
jgi:hypothetical protein